MSNAINKNISKKDFEIEKMFRDQDKPKVTINTPKIRFEQFIDEETAKKILKFVIQEV